MEQPKLTHKSLSAQVADELEKRIAEGVWPVGGKIPSESELIELFGVSRNTLREAMRYLVIAGMVDVRPGDGTYILTSNVFKASLRKRLQKEQSAYVLETRHILEPQIVALAAQRSSDAELQELGQLHQQLLDSYEEMRPDYIELDSKFHVQIAQMCHNPLLYDLYVAIAEFFPQFFKQGLFTFQFGDIDLFLHKELYQLLRQRDAAGARRHMEQMLQQEMSALRQAGVISDHPFTPEA